MTVQVRVSNALNWFDRDAGPAFQGRSTPPDKRGLVGQRWCI